MCPQTGMPASTSVLIVGAISTPPSSFTACAPVSFITRTAAASACDGDSSYVPNGRSTTTNVRCVERTTAAANVIISSSVIGRVVVWPSTTLAAESPTSRKSMSASSKSWAVMVS